MEDNFYTAAAALNGAGVLDAVGRELASAAGTDAAYDAFVDRLRAALASTTVIARPC